MDGRKVVGGRFGKDAEAIFEKRVVGDLQRVNILSLMGIS